MKKIVSILFAILLLLSCSVVALADASVDDFTWDYTPAQSKIKSTAQLYVGLASESAYRDYFYLEPDSFSNGYKFSISKSSGDAKEDHFEYFSFPSFLKLSLNRGGQFGFDTSNAHDGDEGYITYFENGVLYKLKIVIKYAPGNPLAGTTTDKQDGGSNAGSVFQGNYVPDKSEVKRTAQMYMKSSGDYMFTEFTMHFEDTSQQYCRFYTSKSTDSLITENLDKFAFPYFVTAEVYSDGGVALTVNNAHYGNYGYITYFENGTLYKLKINVYADKGYLPENQKDALAAIGRAESAARIAAGTEYDLNAQTPASSKAPESADDFNDVSRNDYYYNSVDWAVKNGITAGTSADTFSPTSTCTRGQVVTFLWRMYGQPKVSGANQFKDVKESDYYAEAVAWAVNEGITLGTSATTFSPSDTCSNAQILCFIQRANGSESSETGRIWYDAAVNWAKENKLLDGTYSGAFNVNGACPRCNVVEYLYRLVNLDNR